MDRLFFLILLFSNLLLWSGCCNNATVAKSQNTQIDSISTNYSGNNVTYYGTRLWYSFNSASGTYLCMGMSDTILVVTDNEILRGGYLYSVKSDTDVFARCFKQANITFNTDIPLQAFIISDGDTLIYGKIPICEADYELERGIIRNNHINPNKNLLIGEKMDILLKRIGLNDSSVLNYSKKSNYILFISPESVHYNLPFKDDSIHHSSSRWSPNIFMRFIDDKIYYIEYGVDFGRDGMKDKSVGLKEWMEYL